MECFLLALFRQATRPRACIVKLFAAVIFAVGHCQSIGRQGKSLPEWSPLQEPTLMVGSQPCSQIFD
jgi:hypothetical protein